MNREILKRLERLEIKHGDEPGPLAIFIVVNDMSAQGKGESLEVLGWKENFCTDGVRVMREPGESEEACGERAAHLARAQPGRDPRSVPCLSAITE
ncbi:hypothetical protein [Halomonas sp. H5]|uniref:hypothetical protein n=1 Tax=Halomonas sp. H5 TaxID=3423910 RepID=UPI003D36E7D7